MKAPEAGLEKRGSRGESVQAVVEPLIARLLVGMNALDAAIPRQSAPDYSYFYQELKAEKGASLAQLMAALRAHGERDRSDPRAFEILVRGQAKLSQALSTLTTLRALRVAEAELINACVDSLDRLPSGGLVARAVRGALGRAIVGATLLAAHIAKMSEAAEDTATLPRALNVYFAGDRARVCMRCLLDRPGRRGSLERVDPHPFTYICAACHDDVHAEIPSDLIAELDRAEKKVQHAHIIHKALSRPSRLAATRQPLHVLSGIEPDVPIPAAEQPLDVPAALGTPAPQAEAIPIVEAPVPGESSPEKEYVELLLDYRSPRQHW